MSTYKEFKLFDFNPYDYIEEEDDDDNDGFKSEPNIEFMIQMFGINEIGETCSIQVTDFHPFFYVKIPDEWTIKHKHAFKNQLTSKMGKYHQNSIFNISLVKKKKLYGFDGGKYYNFFKVEFKNFKAFNRGKNMWYYNYKDRNGENKRKLMEDGLKINSRNLQIYEANIPPLLKFFHTMNISPSGWIKIPMNKCTKNEERETTCTYEYTIRYNYIESLPEKETSVPYKICSFDIEANSSHGDFPLPIKNYKKLATNIVDAIKKRNINENNIRPYIKNYILCAFEYDYSEDIDVIYAKKKISENEIENIVEKILNSNVSLKNCSDISGNDIESMFSNVRNDEDSDNENEYTTKNVYEGTHIIDLLLNDIYNRTEKIEELNKILNYSGLPKVKGDEVTFIGSTFIKNGESKPYLNHCIVLNGCDKPEETKNCEIETYDSEKKVLLAWKDLIDRENPDIIIGYNIFGFDYEFMFRRALETNCAYDFLQLSRNIDKICGNLDTNPLSGGPCIENSSIVIASGQHDLHYIKMDGRLQIDLYNYFRRDFNLTSYKLDYVSGYFIGDNVKSIKYDESESNTIVESKNLAGLEIGCFIHFEESSHTVDYYKDGAKFKVINIDKKQNEFTINTIESPDMNKNVRWCLAKDDVTPQDIFEKTKGSDKDRAEIAKYCIQDCNLVHELLKKIDVITGFIEMSKICSVPISYLVLRGQGIKLTSFISQKCSENDTLMPVIEKKEFDDGYEGAIVLDPKCNLYLEDPVACVDYGSLYPSSMISENLCHSSKVWTKEYDLYNNLITETGEKDEEGEFKYDDLEDYKYVDVTYDTFKYVRKTEKSAAVKVKKGYKICRFAQYPDGKAIMPSVLEELLKSRKATKKLMAKETDPFMKNILDKRQLSIKLTANSLYGQCGARTSTFYEKDVAASTTATGRLLLTYAKRLIEDVYGDTICETKNYGKVRTNAEYIYGDTDSVFFCFYLKELDGTPIKNKKALEITIELAQQAGELASEFLKKPHDLEYEKTFLPFCLLSKKRYVGMLYELDHEKCKRKSMGIVLKRRDNAPIVKDVYGGIIDILMKDQNISKAIEYLQLSLQDIIDEKCPIEKLIITKSLRSNYKNPETIAHKVLADRMGTRDPGNKPSVGDRIPFAYICNNNKKALQGDRIEHPDYIKTAKLKLDYGHYITNQIMKPVQQVFALVLEEIPSFKNKIFKKKKFKDSIENFRNTLDDDKFEKKVEKLRNDEIKSLLFEKYIRHCDNLKNNNRTIQSFF